MNWLTYTAPDPFVVDSDYQRPYWARHFEEIMHNINEAEAALDLTPTVWYRYSPASPQEPFVPLQGGQQQLVGFDPQYAEYILRMRTALVDIWGELGVSRSTVLQSRFGYKNWIDPAGYDTDRQEFTDRDIEELRFIIAERLMTGYWYTVETEGYGSHTVEMPGYYEADEEQRAAMRAAALTEAWAVARTEAWDGCLNPGLEQAGTGSSSPNRRWHAHTNKWGESMNVQIWLSFRGVAYRAHPNYYSDPNWPDKWFVKGSVAFKADSFDMGRIYARDDEYDHQPIYPEMIARQSDGVSLKTGLLPAFPDGEEFAIDFELTHETPYLLITFGLGSPPFWGQNPLPEDYPEDMFYTEPVSGQVQAHFEVSAQIRYPAIEHLLVVYL